VGVLTVMLAAGAAATACGRAAADGCVCPTEGRVMFLIHVPEEAKVFINDHPTTTPGSQRVFVSPGLLPGHRYPYEIRAERVLDGNTQQQVRRATLEAGQMAEVWFDFGTATAKPQVPTPAVRPELPTVQHDAPTITRLTVWVPADARVILRGREIPGSGPMRTFATARLEIDDPPVRCTVRATIERDGRPLSREKTIEFRAGSSYEVRFDFGE